MSDTDKKLDALIDALGFDVEEKHVLDVDSYQRQRCVYALTCLKANKEDHIHPEFKFTKRGEPVNHVGSLIDMSLRIAPDKPTSIKPCTKLKSEILWLLGKAGKQPKKETITIINHQIDLAFNKGIDIE